MTNAEEPIPFGPLLRQYRIAAGLTQEALAECTGLGTRSIQHLEGGVHLPHRATVDRLIRGLGLAAEERRRFERLAQPTPRKRPEVPAPRDEVPVDRTGQRARRHNLPAQLTSFVGRERERADLKQLLGSTRLVTVTGVGGTGKTRLALRVATDLVGSYSDGVWFVDLAPLGDPALVPQTIAGTLGVVEQPGQPILATLQYALRDQHLLLLLDNCEHLIDVCAQVVDTLLRSCTRLRILATSRELLGVGGEATWRVPGLSVVGQERLVRSGGALVPTVLGAEAVQLFVDRARLVAPEFAVTGENAVAVAQICGRLDGIPLAIELAAARMLALSADQILARLDQRFRLLTGGNRTALRRQQTLRATIDWSYELLTEDERALLRRLAVFVGGWFLEAAETVCSFATESVLDPEPTLGLPKEQVVDLLTTLVTKSMVQLEELEQVKGSERRYRLSETIRQYAEEKLFQAGEAEAARDRHRDWFLALAERGGEELEGPDQAEWLVRLDREHDNLRAALDWCQSDAAGAERQLRLAGALGRFWQSRGYPREGRFRLETALARPGPTSPRARALALNWAGTLERYGHNAARGKELLEEGVTLARAIGDRRLLSQTMRHLAFALLNLGEAARARIILEEGLVVSRESGSQREIAWQLVALADALDAEGATEAGERLLEDSLVVGRASGDATPLIMALATLGDRAIARGDYDRGRARLQEALATANRVGIAMLRVYLYLGCLARLEGDLTDARRWVRELLTLAKAGFEHAMSVGLLLGGSIDVAAGRYRPAVRIFSAVGAAGGWQQSPSPEEWVEWLGSLPDDRLANSWLRSYYAGDLATAQGRLGEEDFAQAWAEGQAMTLQDAVELALAERDGETLA